MTAEPSPTPHAAEPVDLPGELGRYGILIAILAFFTGMIVAPLFGSIYGSLTGANSESYGYQIAALLGLWVGTLGVPVLASNRWGTGSLRRDYGLALEWPRDVGLGVVIGLAGQAVVYGIIGLVWIFQRKIDLGEQSAELAQNSHGWQLALLAVFVVVGAPVVEELFFRGLLLRALMGRMPAWAAIVVSGACFGLLHAGTGDAAGTLALVLALAAFGSMLAVAAVRTGRLGPGIVAHMVFNTVSMIQIFAQSGRGH